LGVSPISWDLFSFLFLQNDFLDFFETLYCKGFQSIRKSDKKFLAHRLAISMHRTIKRKIK